jgi:DnaJ-class molecular chaperone
LDVPRDANEDDLRKAYRKQCLKYHPDKQAGADDAEKAGKIKPGKVGERER